MVKRATGGAELRTWRHERSMSLADLGAEVGDEGGEQIRKFESGSRDSLPIPLAGRVAEHTGMALEALLTVDQLRVARMIFALMARDAAA